MTTPTVVGSAFGVDTGNVTTVDVLLNPSQFADGDSIYVIMASDANGQVFTAPARFAVVAPYTNVDIPATTPTATGTVFRQANVSKAAETFNGTDYVFQPTLGTTERQAWFVFAVRGDGGLGPVGTNFTGNSATATIPDLTTLTDHCLVIGSVMTDGISNPFGPATGYTQVGDISGVSAPTVGLYWQKADIAQHVAGANVDITSEQWLGIAFSILEVVESGDGQHRIKQRKSMTHPRQRLRI